METINIYWPFYSTHRLLKRQKPSYKFNAECWYNFINIKENFTCTFIRKSQPTQNLMLKCLCFDNQCVCLILIKIKSLWFQCMISRCISLSTRRVRGTLAQVLPWFCTTWGKTQLLNLFIVTLLKLIKSPFKCRTNWIWCYDPHQWEIRRKAN